MLRTLLLLSAVTSALGTYYGIPYFYYKYPMKNNFYYKNLYSNMGYGQYGNGYYPSKKIHGSYGKYYPSIGATPQKKVVKKVVKHPKPTGPAVPPQPNPVKPKPQPKPVNPQLPAPVQPQQPPIQPLPVAPGGGLPGDLGIGQTVGLSVPNAGVITSFPGGSVSAKGPGLKPSSVNKSTCNNKIMFLAAHGHTYTALLSSQCCEMHNKNFSCP